MQILSLPQDGDRESLDLSAWAGINRAFGEQERTLEVFDRATNEQVISGLRIYLKQELVEAKRYSDALYPGSEGMAYSRFIRMYGRLPSDRYDGERRASMIARNKSYAIRGAAEDLELLAGAGHVDEAIKLAEEVLVRDSSAETVSLLRTHLERAGRAELLTVLGEQYVSD